MLDCFLNFFNIDLLAHIQAGIVDFTCKIDPVVETLNPAQAIPMIVTLSESVEFLAISDEKSNSRFSLNLGGPSSFAPKYLFFQMSLLSAEALRIAELL